MRNAIFLILILTFSFCSTSCKDEENVSIAYKAISIKWRGGVSRGEYIAYVYDDNTYEVKSASNVKIANGTYSYSSDNLGRITIATIEKEYLNLDTNTYITSNISNSVSMNNNNSEFSYSCGNGTYIWFMLESLYNSIYN